MIRSKNNSSLKFNFFMNVILTMSSIVFPLLTFPYVSRILLPEGTGKVAFATSLISYFALFAQLGIPTYGIRACAKVRDDKIELSRTVQELMIINLIMTACVYIVLFALLSFNLRLQAERTLYLIISLTILFNAIGVEWLYKGLEQYTYITVRSVAFKLLAFVAMFVLIHKKEDYIIYGGLTILAASASNIMNFFHAHNYITMRPLGNYHFAKHLKAVAIFFAMTCATTIYTHLDSTMLGFLIGDAEVGYYDAAVKVRTALLGAVTSLGAVLLPRSSYYIQQGRMDEFKRVSRKSLHFVLLLSAPVILYFILFAVPTIDLLSGIAYIKAVTPLRIIMPTLFLVGLTNVLGIQMLVPLGKEKIVLYSEIAGATVDIIFNALLIPTLKSSGAAIGTLVAEIAVFVVQFYALREDTLAMLKSIKYWKIFTATILSSGCASLIYFMHLSSFITLILSAVIFFSVYGVFLLILKESFVKELFMQMINKLKKI